MFTNRKMSDTWDHGMDLVGRCLWAPQAEKFLLQSMFLLCFFTDRPVFWGALRPGVLGMEPLSLHSPDAGGDGTLHYCRWDGDLFLSYNHNCIHVQPLEEQKHICAIFIG